MHVSVGNSKEAKSVEKLANIILADLKKLGLQSLNGKQLLAGTIATKVLQEYLPANVDEDDISELPFHTHLSAYCFSIIEYEGMFDLPEILFSDSNTAVSKGWFKSDKLPTSELWELEENLAQKKHMLDDFDKSFAHLAMMIFMQLEPLVQSCPSLLEQSSDENSLSFSVPLQMMLNDFPEIVEQMVQLPFAPEFDETALLSKLRTRIEYNVV